MTLSRVWAALAGAVLGAIIGSFLATILIRWPAGESALKGRSRCDGCGRTLRMTELVPIASYVVQRARCASCGASIAADHLAIELAGATIGAMALGLRPGFDGFAWALLGWQLLLLAELDWRHRWLPDVLTATLAATGLVAANLFGGLPDRAIGAAVGFVSLWLIAFGYLRLRKREGMGGGDPKLFGAIGAWLGWQALPFVLLAASVIGLLAVLVAKLAGREMTAATEVPFGTLLCAAAVPGALLAAQLLDYLPGR